MATNTIKTRIQHKYNTPTKWAEDTSFVPLKGEICVFNNGTGVKPEMKIGDGTTTLANLPFLKAGGDIAVSRSLTSGTKIATITVDGVATDLYCQTNTDTTYSAGTGLSLNGTTFSISSSVLTTSNYNSYAPTLTGSGASGTWGISITGNAATASSLSSREPTLSTGHENSAITIKGNANGALGIDSYTSLRTAIDFQWYNDYWQIGNLRSGGTASNGFGFACKQDGEESFSLKARITPDSEFVLRNSNYEAVLAPNVITTYGNLLLAGTQRSGYYGICLGNNSNYMTIMSGEIHQGLYSEANNKWIVYYNRENGRIGLGTSSIEGYTVTVGGSLKADNLYGTLHGYADSCGSASNSNWLNVNATCQYGASGLNYFNASLGTTASATSNYGPTADWYHIIRMNHANSQGYYVDLAACFHSDNFYFKRVAAGTNYGYKHIWVEGNSITGAVWNDYAEYRESTTTKPGLVVFENGDDTLSPTTERLSHFAGIISDTWGFCQGETERAKTPIAVAGRVLAYTYRNRNEYQPGDCVCAAPDGTIDIMTREEVERYPDRIVGTVSCVPEYEEWGQGDRPAVKVDGRIWVKVK